MNRRPVDLSMLAATVGAGMSDHRGVIRLRRPLRERTGQVFIVIAVAALSVLWLGADVWPLALIGAVFGAVFVLTEDPG
jgi:hypothetical protein